jgi:hypothetical protein
MSSPQTSQLLTKQQHPRGMLVSSNLLFLKQIEKAPALTGAFSFGDSKMNHNRFVCNILAVTHLK